MSAAACLPARPSMQQLLLLPLSVVHIVRIPGRQTDKYGKLGCMLAPDRMGARCSTCLVSCEEEEEDDGTFKPESHVLLLQVGSVDERGKIMRKH
jgi:hypothetical protein